MTYEETFARNLLLSAEFGKYVLENPDVLDRIPEGAHLIFVPADDEELTKHNRAIAETLKDEGQVVVYVYLKRLAPEPKSRIEEFELQVA